MRICNICNLEKGESEFFKSSKYSDGYEKRCKVCKVEVNRASYERNKEAVKLRSIQKKYKLDEEQYYKFIENGCLVCGSSDNLCIDHDHSCCPGTNTCGKCLRGTLCRRCNVAEGLYKNDPQNAMNLVKYMQKHGIIK